MQLLARHRFSARYVDLDAKELAAMAASIKSIGQLDPIDLYEGKVLDGWQRYTACLKAKVAPRFKDFVGDDAAAEKHVEAKNERRRHKSVAKRAIGEVEDSEWLEGGRPKTGTHVPVSKKKRKSTAEMAKNAKVSERSIKDAKAVVMGASAKMKMAAELEEIALREAAKLSKRPKKEQDKVLAEKKAAPKKRAPPKPKIPTVPQAKYDKLVKEYDALLENRDNLAHELQGCMDVRNGEHVVKYKQAMIEMRTVERRRDELMVQVVEMRRQLNWYEREMKKRGWTLGGKA